MAKISINLKEGTLVTENIVIGIDLGTTNSLVAFINKQTQQPYCIPQNEHNTVPSILYFANPDIPIVGNAAKPYLISHPKQTVYSIKRLMGKSYEDVANYANRYGYNISKDENQALLRIEINNQYYNAVELSALILKELKLLAEKHLGQAVNHAVITVPAYFNDSQRQATRDAGKLANLNVLRIVNEPTAASLAYGIGLNSNEDKTIAVYDLGGGTFDITILRIQNKVFEVLATHGDTYLGGDDIDRLLVEYLCNIWNLDITLLENNETQYQILRLKAEEIKKTLSFKSNSSGTMVINDTEYQYNIDIDVFEKIIAPVLTRTIESCYQALNDAQLKPENIDEIVLVGGSTRIPAITKELNKVFKNKKINNSLHPDEVVALGAAIEADILAGNRTDTVLLDVTPLSLGIETMGGIMDTLIPRNSKIPTTAGRQYTTSKDGQTNLKISVYQGERDLVEHNRKLGEFILTNIPAMPAGLPKIEIQFLLNADGILKVNATELRSGIAQNIEIKPQYGLTDKQVEDMLLASMTNAASDIESKLLQESKVEAEQLIYQCNKLLSQNKSLLAEDELKQTQKLLENLSNACLKNDRHKINSEIERLNDYTRPFAEKMMDNAINSALGGKSIDAV